MDQSTQNGHDTSTNGPRCSEGAPGASQLVFIGTGVSTAIPSLAHLLELDGKTCNVCQDARRPGSRNRRNNVSLLIRYADPLSQTLRNIIVDVGKTFRDAAINVLVPLGVQTLDAILLTHDHADAMGGMDDSRDLQLFDMANGTFKAKKRLPIYLSQASMDVFSSSFPYIVEASKAEEPLSRRVAQLEFNILPDCPSQPPYTFDVCGLAVTALPVYHGGEYIAIGFAFGQTSRILYLSDVSKVPPAVQTYLDEQQFDIIIVDCLHKPGVTHFSHFCIDDALAFTKRMNPVRAYFVGMFCDLEHEETNAYVADQAQKMNCSRLKSIELAYDGLCLNVDL